MFGQNPVALLGICVKLAHEQAPSTNVYKYARGGLSRRAYIYACEGQIVNGPTRPISLMLLASDKTTTCTCCI